MKLIGVAIAFALVVGHLPAQEPIVGVHDEPTNLDTVKQQLIHYHDCQEASCYLPQLEKQIAMASGFLKASVGQNATGKQLALVLDIDETSLSNWTVEMHDDLGYIRNDSDWCVSLRCSQPILPTLQLYREAIKLGVTVFFVTGRPETQRTDTEANLRAAGYAMWGGLYLRPGNHDAHQTVSDYKSSQRGLIVKQGYRIILNVGDQMSDLTGPFEADYSVKLPNPFYFIP